ncbi:MAG: aldehyde ferredoxin oxidoreductase family protein [Archaeoglobaceae archaeon]|nr:aldehyde ferredoxin oxidoreductase family protein [Archaeoglobaceae archaeon]
MNVAYVDLSKEKTKTKEIKELDYFIGGKGAATKLLFNTPPKIDAFHPENAIIFGVGPLNGIKLSGASRMTCVFKSPMTNGYGESQCGGFIAHEMRKTGIDILYIYGKAKKPVYLLIENDNIRIKDASHLWGKDAFETEEILKKDHKGEVLCIGQAGENLVRFACITHRKGRQFGRAGVGAVMGSKMLKAVVFRGDKKIEVSEPEKLDEFREWLDLLIKEKLAGMKKYGTPNILPLVNEAGVLPTKYWQEGSFEKFESIVDLMQKHVKRNSSCYGCIVACGKITKIDDVEVEGPEYETLFALGSLCYNDDLKTIAKANDLCDRYGMDTITTGNVIAFLMACSERGEVEENVKFGDKDSIIDLINKIAFRREIGDVLAEGVKRAAEILNVDNGVHVKGLEPPGYDPRGLYGTALSYATSPRGACHMRAVAHRPNLVGIVDRTSPKGQAAIVKDLEDFYCIVDSLVFCRFLCLPSIGMYWNDIANLYEIVTGVKLSVEDLKERGAKIFDLTRDFNLREGVKDENLPPIFFKPIKHYKKEFVIRKEDFEQMLQDYYRLRGWT